MEKICPPDHKHEANYTCRFSHGCGCSPCREKGGQYLKERKLRLAKIAGGDKTTARRAITHLQRLIDYGISPQRIAALSGVSTYWVTKLRNETDPRREIPVETARRIMWIQPLPQFADPSDRLICRPTLRRVRALLSMGWSPEQIGDELQVSTKRVWQIASGQHPFTPTEVHHLSRIYPQWAFAVPKPDRPNHEDFLREQRAECAARGWVTSFGWRSIDTDSQKPHETADIHR